MILQHVRVNGSILSQEKLMELPELPYTYLIFHHLSRLTVVTSEYAVIYDYTVCHEIFTSQYFVQMEWMEQGR